MVDIYNGLSLSHKKNEIMPYAATWTDLEVLLLRGLSQRKTNTMYNITYMWNLWHK